MSKVSEAQAYVRQLFLDRQHAALVFHNYTQTEEIAAVCEQIADDANLTDEETSHLLIATWFLYTGYLEDRDNPFAASAKICRQYLQERHFTAEAIEQITHLIITAEEEPETPLQKILHDGRWSFLGRKRFFRLAELWRLEVEKLSGTAPDYAKWNERMLDLLTQKKFYTAWALDAYTSRKHKNILEQTDNLKKARKITRREKTGKDYGRGIDTLYRNTLRGHLDLSAIADGKANMIISINTLVLSILITAGSAGISFSQFNVQENLYIIVPIIILMSSSLLAIIFAVLSASPKYSGESFTVEDVKQHRVSLLFFNKFLMVSKDTFVHYLRDLKENETLLYDDLAKDVYNLGGVLKRKYRLINIAYRIFVGGLALSFISFIVVLAIKTFV